MENLSGEMKMEAREVGVFRLILRTDVKNPEASFKN